MPHMVSAWQLMWFTCEGWDFMKVSTKAFHANLSDERQKTHELTEFYEEELPQIMSLPAVQP